jgi:hypothetical protein
MRKHVDFTMQKPVEKRTSLLKTARGGPGQELRFGRRGFEQLGGYTKLSF